MRHVVRCSLVIALVGCGVDDSRSEPSTTATTERVTSTTAETLAPATPAPQPSTSMPTPMPTTSSLTTTRPPRLITTVPTTDPVEDTGGPGAESIGVAEKITITIRDAEDG